MPFTKQKSIEAGLVIVKRALLISGVFLVACKSGNCRQNRDGSDALQPMTAEQEKLMNQVSSKKERVRVAIPDGSLACQPDSGMKMVDAEAKLKNVPIYKKERKSDGLIRTSVCDRPTGYYFVFEIDRKNLAQATAAKFIEWTFD